MTEIDFVVGDRVVTSRGIYGTIVSIDESADTSQVNIGSKTVTLYNNQLWSVKNRISVVCYYTDGYEIIIGLLHFLNSLNYMTLLSH